MNFSGYVLDTWEAHVTNLLFSIMFTSALCGYAHAHFLLSLPLSGLNSLKTLCIHSAGTLCKILAYCVVQKVRILQNYQ